MKERPINLRAWEVQAIRAGRKTQFRRVVRQRDGSNPDEASVSFYEDGTFDKVMDFSKSYPYWESLPCPLGASGDKLWVRETWAPIFEEDTGFCGVQFAAGGMAEDDKRAGKYLNGTDQWRSPVCMPRWASRFDLELVSVRVERLDEISEEDAIAEGIVESELGQLASETLHTYKSQRVAPVVLQYADFWESSNGPGSWEANPFVWVVEFQVIKP